MRRRRRNWKKFKAGLKTIRKPMKIFRKSLKVLMTRPKAKKRLKKCRRKKF